MYVFTINSSIFDRIIEVYIIDEVEGLNHKTISITKVDVLI